jgi:hypothetical protein
MQYLLLRGSKGDEVAALRKCLAKVLGTEATLFGELTKGDDFDADLEAAVRRWQTGVGLIADGIVGPRCLQVLELQPFAELKQALTAATVSSLFPATKPANVSRYLPYVAAAMQALALVDAGMLLVALGTIRAETEGFLPIAEFQSQFNTPPGAAPFSSYDPGTNVGKVLGNTEVGDGARFKGRGFVQLTGRSNYKTQSATLHIDLLNNPDLANQPEVAALILASFLYGKRTAMKAALKTNDLRAVRKLVNGGSHGLDRFKSVFALAQTAWQLAPSVLGAGKVRKLAKPTTVKVSTLVSGKTRPRLTAKYDAPDLRDRAYLPPPISLSAEFPASKDIASLLPKYSKAGLILNQGQEGACTGFGLACVVNHLRWQQQGTPVKFDSVSPRMLYTFARRYDEYAGENYEGSSCRGALKGWFKHGVCLEGDWPYEGANSVQPKFGYAERAAANTLGVYYRIDKKRVTDMQAAIQSVGAVYVSAFTHRGWDTVRTSKIPRGHQYLPLIDFDGEPSETDGHAFALVGFNQHGFIIQNSWGYEWGAGGFAVLGYEDWLANGMDAWVAALGVPGVVSGRTMVANASATKQRAQSSQKWWSEEQAYRHSVVLGNDGRVAKYLTEDERTRTLAHQVAVLPDLWFRQQPAGSVKRLVIYAHGGLNSEGDAVKRAQALGRYFIGNGCYPLFVIWKTGMMESLRNILGEWWRGQPQRAGMAGGFSDITDRAIEASIGSGVAKPLWSEMKENAGLGFTGGRGGEWLVRGLQQLLASCDGQVEISVVGHSAGSIFLGHMLSAMAASAGLLAQVKGVHLYAPACTVQFANRHYATNAALLQKTYISLLSDRNEVNDNTAQIYRKSLLYLVSNALEADRRTPLLGMHKVFDANKDHGNWDGTSATTDALSTWRRAWSAVKDDPAKPNAAHLQVLDSDKITTATTGPQRAAASHGGFDNDVEVVSRTLQLITESKKLLLPVDDLRGF